MAVNRRWMLKAGALAAAVALTRPEFARGSASRAPVSPEAASPSRDFSMGIRAYLAREARLITRGALAGLSDAAAWRDSLADRRKKFFRMMGLDGLLESARREPPAVHVTGTVDRPRYRIEKLYFESLPSLYVTANLYVPKGLAGRAPAVIYFCGHAQTQKVHYQAHPRRFAELGFVSLIVDTVQLGEARGYHHGPFREGWFHWYGRGYTPAGIELWNGIRGLDLLAARPEVDAQRLGVTGLSGGGATTWWLAAADERVRAAAPACGTATLASHIEDLTIDGHCDCMWWINTGRWDLADVGALIAPRPLLIASSNRDPIFTIASIREVHSQLEGLYRTLGSPENLRLVETPGGHGYHPRSRTAIFSWFVKHLQGRDVPREAVGDLDESPEKLESEETLRVFVQGLPPENRVRVIHEELIPPAPPPQVSDRAQLERTRLRVTSALLEEAFAAFPSPAPPLDTQVEIEYENTGSTGARFAFTPETGWRLRGRLTVAAGLALPAPAVLALRSPGEHRHGWAGGAEELLSRIRVAAAKIVVEPRGTGETAWGEELQWHLRRAAAWTGRTLASMRVWDTLRALEAVRALPRVDKEKVALAAREEMAAVALYAALLDGRVSALYLESPPATQNAPSARDGRGAAIEMLNCLRVTDLAQVTGLMFPTELVFIGDCPATYDWAEEVYRRLGVADKFRRTSGSVT